MAIKTENTAAGPVMLRPDTRDKYAPNNLILYRTSLALYRNMKDEGIFNEEEYTFPSFCTNYIISTVQYTVQF